MTSIKIIAKNKRAHFDFHIQEKFEVGIVLQGTEVKTLRLGKVTLTDAFVQIDQNFEAWIYNMNIPHYAFGNISNHEEARKRKLLLHKRDIVKIFQEMQTGGLTVVPTAIYFKQSFVKLEVALAKGKKLHDKREASAERDIKRKMSQGDYE